MLGLIDIDLKIFEPVGPIDFNRSVPNSYTVGVGQSGIIYGAYNPTLRTFRKMMCPCTALIKLKAKKAHEISTINKQTRKIAAVSVLFFQFGSY